MKIKVIRGQNQIGGSIIEISSSLASIIFDVGVNLDEINDVTVPDIKGLFVGNRGYDAIFISHYHADHMGLLDYVIDDIPIYIGKQAFNIVCAAAEYKGEQIGFAPKFFRDQEIIRIKDISILPLRCDHSAYDSYMFMVECDGQRVLYTGDFRGNGRIDCSATFRALSEVDALIIEGTMLSRETFDENIKEETLEDIAVNQLYNTKAPAFLMSSAMNVDRIITGYHVAQRTKRLFLEDLYTAGIMESIGAGVPLPECNGVNVFMTGGDRQYQPLQNYSGSKIGKHGIANSSFLMCVRPSMRNYIMKLSEICSFEGGVLFYSMWKGYQEKCEIKDFLNTMESFGVRICTLHTSGHADIKTITELINSVNPQVLIPVHTENPHWYERFERTLLLDSDEIVI